MSPRGAEAATCDGARNIVGRCGLWFPCTVPDPVPSDLGGRLLHVNVADRPRRPVRVVAALDLNLESQQVATGGDELTRVIAPIPQDAQLVPAWSPIERRWVVANRNHSGIHAPAR